MSKKKDLPANWQRSDKAVKALQVAFYVDEQVQKSIRQTACLQGISPSDMIRTIINLPVSSPPKRPRLTASLCPQDYQELAKRYGVDSTDCLEIKRYVMQELIDFSNQHNNQKEK